MSDKFSEAELAEINDLTARVNKIVSRRKFMSTAATAAAFTIPASLVTGIPADALAAGSSRPNTMGRMMRRRRMMRRMRRS